MSSWCPPDFEQGPGTSCHWTCPSRFKYVQRGGDSCVYVDDPSYRLTLTQLPMISPQASEPPEYSAERARLQTDLSDLMTRLNQSKVPSLDEAVQEYDSIQSEWQRVSSTQTLANSVQLVTKNLKTARPEVQPQVAIRREREAILKGQPSLLVVQVALVAVVLALLMYIIVPTQYAHYGAFLVLSTGIAVGIFLSK